MDDNPMFDLELNDKSPNSLKEIVDNLGINDEYEDQADTAALPHDNTPPNVISFPTPDTSPTPDNDSAISSYPTPPSPFPIDISQQLLEKFYFQFKTSHKELSESPYKFSQILTGLLTSI